MSEASSLPERRSFHQSRRNRNPSPAETEISINLPPALRLRLLNNQPRRMIARSEIPDYGPLPPPNIPQTIRRLARQRAQPQAPASVAETNISPQREPPSPAPQTISSRESPVRRHGRSSSDSDSVARPFRSNGTLRRQSGREQTASDTEEEPTDQGGTYEAPSEERDDTGPQWEADEEDVDMDQQPSDLDPALSHRREDGFPQSTTETGHDVISIDSTDVSIASLEEFHHQIHNQSAPGSIGSEEGANEAGAVLQSFARKSPHGSSSATDDISEKHEQAHVGMNDYTSPSQSSSSSSEESGIGSSSQDPHDQDDSDSESGSYLTGDDSESEDSLFDDIVSISDYDIMDDIEPSIYPSFGSNDSSKDKYFEGLYSSASECDSHEYASNPISVDSQDVEREVLGQDFDSNLGYDIPRSPRLVPLYPFRDIPSMASTNSPNMFPGTSEDPEEEDMIELNADADAIYISSSPPYRPQSTLTGPTIVTTLEDARSETELPTPTTNADNHVEIADIIEPPPDDQQPERPVQTQCSRPSGTQEEERHSLPSSRSTVSVPMPVFSSGNNGDVQGMMISEGSLELMQQEESFLREQPSDDHIPNSQVQATPAQHRDRAGFDPRKPSRYFELHGFDYEQASSRPLIKKEYASIIVHAIRHYKGMSRAGEEDIAELMRIISPENTPLNHRTTEARIMDRTGISIVRYDVCKNSCFCFTSERGTGDDTCDYCDEPRFDEEGKPWKTFDYVPLIPRLMLQYSNADRAKELMTYRFVAEAKSKDAEEPRLVDFWGSGLHQELVDNNGMFAEETDIGFFFSTDGIDLFRNRSQFTLWPLILVNLNLPPEKRYNDDNVLHLGIMPGPDNPKDVDSFLVPLQDEMRLLHKGVPEVYNGHTKDPFTLRANIVLIGSDIPARKKLSHTLGIGSYKFCMYCKTEAVGAETYCYCPFQPPKTNLPAAGSRKKTEKGLRCEEGLDMPTYDPTMLEARTHEEFMKAYTLFKDGKIDEAIETAGVNGYSVLSNQFGPSVKSPDSYGYDGMHLWFENVIPRLFDHWRGYHGRKQWLKKMLTDAERTHVPKDGIAKRGRGGRGGRGRGRGRGRGGGQRGGRNNDIPLLLPTQPAATPTARKRQKTVPANANTATAAAEPLRKAVTASTNADTNAYDELVPPGTKRKRTIFVEGAGFSGSASRPGSGYLRASARIASARLANGSALSTVFTAINDKPATDISIRSGHTYGEPSIGDEANYDDVELQGDKYGLTSSASESETDAGESDASEKEMFDPESITTEKPDDNVLGEKEAQGSAKTKKKPGPVFEETGEEYCISKATWKVIGRYMDETRRKGYIPGAFGINIRSISDHVHKFKAEEWKNWTLRYSLIYLKGILPDKFYKGYEQLVYAIMLCCQYELSRHDILTVRNEINSFIEHFEAEYYRYDYERLNVCLPVFHFIAHVADALERLGPQFVYAQWCVERACGTISRGVKSRSEVNRNVSLNIQRMECYNHLKYTISEETFYELVDDEDYADMVSHAKRKFEFMVRILNRGSGFFDGEGNKTTINPKTTKGKDIRDGGHDTNLILMGQQKGEAVPVALRKVLRNESLDFKTWRQCSKDDFKGLILQKYVGAKYFTATTKTIMYSSLLEPRTLKRHAHFVTYEWRNEDGGMDQFVGQIQYFFDIVPSDEEDLRQHSISERAGLGRVLIRNIPVLEDGNLKYVDGKGKREKRLHVIPAAWICDLVGFVVRNDRLYMVHKEGCLHIE